MKDNKRKNELYDYQYVLRTVKDAIVLDCCLMQELFNDNQRLHNIFNSDDYFIKKLTESHIKMTVQGRVFDIYFRYDDEMSIIERNEAEKETAMYSDFKLNRAFLGSIITYFKDKGIKVFDKELEPETDHCIESNLGIKALSYILLKEELKSIHEKIVCIEKLERMTQS